MKIIHNLVVATLIVACGCSNKAESTASISGKIENGNGKKLVIQQLTNSEIVRKDSVDLKNDGSFEFKFNSTDAAYYRLWMDNNNFAFFIAEPGDKIEFKAQANNLNYTAEIKGTKNNEKLRKIGKMLQKNSLTVDSLQKLFQGANELPNAEVRQKELIGIYENIVEQERKILIQEINENPDGFYLLSFTEKLDKDNDIEIMQKMEASLSKKYPKNEYVKDFSNRVKELSKLAIGTPAPEIELPDRDGNNVKLSSLKGNIVLIDFWASWCRPCRQENPNVVRVYNKYKDKNFTVFSVSLDKQKENWLEAIKADGLVWPNHVSDLAFWNSKVVPLYKIEGIPFTVLVDKNGNIAGKNLRGEQLEKKVAELIK